MYLSFQCPSCPLAGGMMPSDDFLYFKSLAKICKGVFSLLVLLADAVGVV